MLQLRNLLGALRQAVNTLFPRNQAPHDLDLNRASLPSNSKEGIGPQVWAYLDRPLGEFHRPATGSEVRRLGLDPALHRRTVSELKGFWSKRFPLTASYSSMRFLANILEAIATIEPQIEPLRLNKCVREIGRFVGTSAFNPRAGVWENGSAQFFGSLVGATARRFNGSAEEFTEALRSFVQVLNDYGRGEYLYEEAAILVISGEISSIDDIKRLQIVDSDSADQPPRLRLGPSNASAK